MRQRPAPAKTSTPRPGGPAPVPAHPWRFKPISLAVALACGGTGLITGFAAYAQTLPTGAQITAGGATISQTAANAMLVKQTTDKLAVNWQTFNIGAGNSVRFDQPSSSSIALNRVIGGSRSEIYGNLTSNGQVFLINPNGVLFGAGAQVDVGGLVASTLNITDKNFLDGNYVFSDPANTGSVVNQGTLTAHGSGTGGGYLALIGNQAVNTGTMKAQLGSVVLGAGGTAQLTLADSKLVKFEVQQGALGALAENGGLIQANGGQVILTAGAVDDLLKSTVNNTGIIEAQTVEGQPGNILLLSGMASGTTNVGGTLDASAPAALNPNGGNGGFIETSGGTVNIASDAKGTTAASAGLTGTWLVDPSDFTIASSGGNMTGATLSSIMAGSDFTINSSAGGNSGSGDVNINDNVSWSAPTWLTINAAHSINFRAVMTLAGASKLIMYTNAGNGGDAAVGGGSINMAVNGAGGFAGRIDIPGRSGNGFLYLQGLDTTVINSLGSWGSTTGTDLQGIQGNLNGLYALGSDIDASATSTASWYGPNGYLFSNGFRTLGYNGGIFKGTLDGLGHTVRNLAVASSSYHGFGDYGLFSRINNTGVVQNLGLVGGGLLSGGSGTVHNVGGIAGENSGTIRNTFNTGGVTGTAGSASGGLVGYGTGGSIIGSYGTGNVFGFDAGGLVGLSSGGSIANSYATGNISGVGVTGAAGGLAGQFSGGTITNSSAFGAVSNSSRVGGLVGTGGGTITTSHAHGTVTGAASGSNAGGLVGFWNGNITNSFSSSNVIAPGSSSVAGGLVGSTTSGINATTTYATGNVNSGGVAGGLIGFDINGNILTSFASGSVSGNNGVGGLVGIAQQGIIQNTYATGSVNGNSYVGGLVGNASAITGPSGGNISISYANNVLTGNSHVGGLVGSGTMSSGARDLYWNVTLSGQSASGFSGSPLFAGDPSFYVTGLTAAQMLQFGSYYTGSGSSVWNLSSSGGAGTTWRIYSGDTAPLLEAFLTPLTITANNVTKVYDATSVGLTNVTYSLPSAAGSSHLIGFNTPYGNVTKNNVGTYAANIWSDQLGYDITFTGGGLTVTPATLTGSGLTAQNKVYDGTTAATVTGSLGGIKGSDSVALTAAAFASKNVANGINVTGLALTGADAGNYTFSAPALSANITPATLTVTANSASRVYGAAAPALSGSVTGFVNGETLATATTGTEVFSTTAAVGSNVGTYGITGSGLTANNGNYLFTQAAGNSTALTINPATLTVTANTANRTYGAANPALSGTVTGFVNGDTLATATTGTEVFSTTANTGSNVGNYAITGSGLTANNGNYLFTQAAGNSSALTINPATLAVTANSASRLYGGANPAFTGTVTGFVNGQTLATATTGTEVFSTTANTGSNAGSYGITGAGLTANNGNYVFVQAPGNASALTINPATLTVTANTANRTYGAADPVFSGSVTGFVNGQTLATATTGTEVFSTNATAGSNVGSYGITGAGLTANNGNYVFVQAPGNASALTINPAALTVTASTVNRTYGAANPALTGTVTGFVNGDTLATATTGSEVFSTSATTLSNVGNYAITGSGLTANHGNYMFAQAPGNFSALTINPAVLMVSGLSLASSTREYDGSTQMLLAGTGVLTGLVGGQTLTLGSYATLAGPDVGSQAVTRLVTISDGTGANAGLASNYTLTQPSAPNVTITQLPSATWVGGSTGNWSNPANWAPTSNLAATGAVPTLSNVGAVVIPAGVTLTYDNVPGSTVVNNLTAGSGGNFTFNGGALTVGGGSMNLATLTMNSGTLNMGASVNVGDYFQNGGTWTQVGATLPAFAAGNFGFGGGSFVRALGGDGSSLAPYKLTDIYGVQGMRGLSGSSYVLQNDIDATGTMNWNGGAGFRPNGFFGGSLDGQGHSINGLTINSHQGGFVGFFYGVSATGTVSNVGLRGATVSESGAYYVGGLAGYNYGTISNSYFTGMVSGGNYVGGLVGVNNGTISNSYAAGGVRGDNVIGGLVGMNGGTISNSYATAAVRLGAYGSGAGGLVGYNANTIDKSYATGQVSGEPSSGGMGAFVGWGGTGSGNFYDKSVNPGMTGGAYGAPDTVGSVWGLSTAEIHNRTNFTSATSANGGVNPGWDLTGTWLVYDGNTAPLLRSFLRPLTVTVNDATKTYDGLISAGGNGVSYSVTPNAPILGTPNYTGSGTNVGTYALTADGLYSTQGGYNISYAPGTLTINPATLTVTANAANRTYGAVNPVLTGTVSGFVNGETLATATTGTETFGSSATGASNVGSYDITGAGLAANNGNYVFVQAPGNASALTVNPATLTVTANAASRTYGAANPALSGSVTGFVNGETLATATTGTETFSTGATATSNVGNYAVTGSGLTANNGNYVFVQAPGNTGALTVNPAPLTVTASNASKVYGQTPLLTGFTSSGLQNGETIGSVTESSAGIAGTAGVAGGPYAITASNATGGTFSAGNYVITYANGSLTVTPAPLTVTAANASKVYGQTPVLSGFSSSGLQNGETIGSVTESSAGTSGTASVAGGPYAITTSSATGGTFSAGNYNITYADGSLTVTPAPLTVTAANASKVYGQTPVLTGFTSSGLQNGETVGSVTETSAGTAGAAGVAGGPYTIVASGATGGTFDATNYNITYANGGLTVTPAPLTVTASNASKVYGQTPLLTGFTSSGLQNGETIGSVTETSSGTTGIASVAGGPYAITASNAVGGTFSAGNYSITYNNGSLTVTPAPLTVTASNASKTYGQTPVLTGFSSSGLQNGETIGSVTETSAGTAGTASVAGGPYAITASSATGGTFSAGNYNITYADGSLTVTPASLTVTASNASKVYGQAPVLNGFSSSGLQNGETIGSVTETSAGTAGTASVTGGPYAITASNAAGGTFSAGNYSITYADGSLTVTPAPLTVTASNASKVYGQTPVLTGFTSSGLQNGETIGSVTESSAGTTGTAGVAGGPYAIVASGATGGTFSAGNYSITYADGSLTVTPAPLTVTASNASKVYGQTPVLTGFTSSGLQNGETVGSVTETSAGTSGTASVAGGPYAIIARGATSGTFDATNYSITYANGSLTVTPAPLTVTASDATKVYGQTPALTGFTSTGLLNGESIGSVTESSAGTAGTASVAGGPYAITASNAGGGTFSAGNYNITYADGSLTVTPATLTVTANAASRTYGAANPVLTGTVTGFFNGETLATATTGTETFSTGATGTSNVGSYAVTGSGLSANNGNYVFAQAPGNASALTVTQAPLTVTADNASKTYGQTPVLSGFSSSGLQNGETIGSVTESSAGAAGNAGVAAGPYAITASNAGGGSFNAGNYNITYADGSLTVNPAPLIITANPYTKTYDGNAYRGGNGIWYSGYVNGENGSVLGGTLTWGGSGQGAVAAGGYTLTPGGLTSSNYAISYVDGALLINAAPLLSSQPPGVQGAVTTAQQPGAGSNGIGGGTGNSGGSGGSSGQGGGSQPGDSQGAGQESGGQGTVAQNEGGQSSTGQEDSNQSIAGFPPKQQKDKDAAKNEASGQVMFTIVGAGVNLPAGVK